MAADPEGLEGLEAGDPTRCPFVKAAAVGDLAACRRLILADGGGPLEPVVFDTLVQFGRLASAGRTTAELLTATLEDVHRGPKDEMLAADGPPSATGLTDTVGS